MFKFTRFLGVCAVGFFFGNVSHAQTTVNLAPTKDAYITSQSPTTNFGTSTVMRVGTTKISTLLYYQRGFVEFDLSGIPANAIIHSATLNLYVNTTSGINPSWHIKRVESTWGETTVTANNQPTISTNSTLDWTSTGTQSSSPHTFDVKSMVQRMVYGQVTNYGWSVQVQNEAYNGTGHKNFHTREYGTTSLRPKLTVVWFYPPSLSSVNVTHESAVGASDGGVSFTLNGKISSTVNYEWINGSGTVLASGTGVANPTMLTNVPYGWYGFHVKGTTYNEELYMAFLIGTQCEEVTINFAATTTNTFSKYMDNALCSNFNNVTHLNGGENTNFQSGREFSGSAYSSNSYLRFNVWMDDAFTVNQSDLTLQGKSHLGTVNSAEFRNVTAPWNESLIAWSIQPSLGTTTVTSAQTTSSTEDEVVNLTSFWQAWKSNNTTNHGLRFQLQSLANYTNRQQFHSPTAVAVEDRPSVTFKLGLYREDDLLFCNPNANPYVELQPSLDGGYVIAYEGNLKFTFQEAYDIDPSEFWSLKIFDSNHLKIASCDASGTTTGGMTSQSYSFDDNRFTIDLSTITSASVGQFYLLEVTTQKGDRHYLKVLYQD